MTEPDPVLARRAMAARAASLGRRAGYSLFALAIGLFIVGFAVELSPGLVRAIVSCLAVGSVLLAPSIILGYSVKAAEREDREQGLA